MSTEQHKALIRRFHDEFLNTGNLSAADELIAPDGVLYFAGERQPGRGPDVFKQALTMMRTAFPDIRWTPEAIVAEGDLVAARVVARGTHLGPFMGIPPTGRPVTLHGNAIVRVADGKIAEDWAMPNLLGLLQQLGAVPTLEHA